MLRLPALARMTRRRLDDLRRSRHADPAGDRRRGVDPAFLPPRLPRAGGHPADGHVGRRGGGAGDADRPDVVILDIDLPDQSGLETFRRIHELDPKIPVIFITGHGTTATAIEAMSLGAYEYLLKPLELDPLCDLVARAFEISRLMRVPAVIAGGRAGRG